MATQGGDDSSTVSGSPVAPQDNGQAAFNYFVGQGLAPHQAAGIVGNLQGESGQGLNPTAVNPGDGRDGSDSIGIGQWNGARAQALKDYAASKGTDWTDLNTQLGFLHSELKGPENKAYSGLLAAQTPEEAGQAMLAYERPKDWNKPGAHPERAANAARAYAAYSGQPTSLAPPSAPSAPQSLAPPQQPAQKPAPSILAALPTLPSGLSPAPSPLAGAFTGAAPSAPIFVPPRKQIDLSGLKALLASRAPIFSNQGQS